MFFFDIKEEGFVLPGRKSLTDAKAGVNEVDNYSTNKFSDIYKHQVVFDEEGKFIVITNPFLLSSDNVDSNSSYDPTKKIKKNINEDFDFNESRKNKIIREFILESIIDSIKKILTTRNNKVRNNTKSIRFRDELVELILKEIFISQGIGIKDMKLYFQLENNSLQLSFKLNRKKEFKEFLTREEISFQEKDESIIVKYEDNLWRQLDSLKTQLTDLKNILKDLNSDNKESIESLDSVLNKIPGDLMQKPETARGTLDKLETKINDLKTNLEELKNKERSDGEIKKQLDSVIKHISNLDKLKAIQSNSLESLTQKLDKLYTNEIIKKKLLSTKRPETWKLEGDLESTLTKAQADWKTRIKAQKDQDLEQIYKNQEKLEEQWALASSNIQQEIDKETDLEKVLDLYDKQDNLKEKTLEKFDTLDRLIETKKAEKFGRNHSQYDLNLVIRAYGDEVVGEAALNLFKKHPETSIYIELNPNKPDNLKVIYYDKEGELINTEINPAKLENIYKEVSQKNNPFAFDGYQINVRSSIVNHMESLNQSQANELINSTKEKIWKHLPKNQIDGFLNNMVGCKLDKNLARNINNELPKILNDQLKLGIRPDSIKTHSRLTFISVSESGRKIYHNMPIDGYHTTNSKIEFNNTGEMLSNVKLKNFLVQPNRKEAEIEEILKTPIEFSLQDSTPEYRTPEQEEIASQISSTNVEEDPLYKAVEALRERGNIPKDYFYIETKDNKARFVSKEEFERLSKKQGELIEEPEPEDIKSISLDENHPIVKIIEEKQRFLDAPGEPIMELAHLLESRPSRFMQGFHTFNEYSGHAMSAHGMLMSLKRLLEWSKESSKEEGNPSDKNWALAQLIYGVGQLPSQMILEKGLPALISRLDSSLSTKFMGQLEMSLGRGLGGSFAGVGLVFDIYNLGKSIESYGELSKINPELRNLAIANLVFSAIQPIVSTGFLIGSLIGMGSTASLSLGLDGIGIFIGALIVSMKLEEKNQAALYNKYFAKTFQFFAHIKDSIIENDQIRSFKYDREKSLIYIDNSAVVIFIDLKNNKMKYGDKKIYSVSYAEGTENLDDSADIPRISGTGFMSSNKDENRALSLYEGFNSAIKQGRTLVNFENAKEQISQYTNFLLPCELNEICDYEDFYLEFNDRSGAPISPSEVNFDKIKIQIESDKKEAQKNKEPLEYENIDAALEFNKFHRNNRSFVLGYTLGTHDDAIKYFHNYTSKARETFIEIILDDKEAKGSRALIIQDAYKIFKTNLEKQVQKNKGFINKKIELKNNKAKEKIDKEKKKREKEIERISAFGRISNFPSSQEEVLTLEIKDLSKEIELIDKEIKELEGKIKLDNYQNELNKAKEDPKKYLAYHFEGNGGNYVLNLSQMQIKGINIKANKEDQWTFELSSLYRENIEESGNTKLGKLKTERNYFLQRK